MTTSKFQPNRTFHSADGFVLAVCWNAKISIQLHHNFTSSNSISRAGSSSHFPASESELHHNKYQGYETIRENRHCSWVMIIYIMADEQNRSSYTTAGKYRRTLQNGNNQKQPYALTSLHLLLHSYLNYWTNMRQLLA